MMEKKADRSRREESGPWLRGGRGRESVGRKEEVGGGGEYKSFALRN